MERGLPATTGRPRILLTAALCAALVLVTFAAFRSLLSSAFINFDDPLYVTENVHVQMGFSPGSIAWAFTTTEGANWHPQTWLSHMLDVQFFGLDPHRHHLTSLLFHMLNTVLLFLLFARMTGALWRSAFVAALFALHPLHVESVAWIAERKDVLSTFFWLLTTGAWWNYAATRKRASYALMLACYALGLMAKPMLVSLPFTLLLLDYWPLQRLMFPLREHAGELKTLLREKAPLFAMAAASCIVTVIVQHRGGAVETLKELSYTGRLVNAVTAYATYLGKTLWPSSLAVFYPHPHLMRMTWAAAGAALLLLGVTAVVLRAAKRAPYLPFGWFWFLGTLVPVIGLVQVGEQAMADRYTYIPLIGIFIAAAWGLADAVRRRPRARVAVVGACAATLPALFVVTSLQTGYWRDDETLFTHALAVTANNAVAHNNLGVALFHKGRTAEAMAHYLEAVRIDPDYPDVHNNLGLALVGPGRVEEAVAHYREALRARPKSVKDLNNMGLALVKMNKNAEAEDCFRQAVRLDSNCADAHYNLGIVLANAGRWDEAVEHYREALRITPTSVHALNNMGLALKKMNRMTEALDCFERAVRLDPGSADVQNNLGLLLANTGRPAEAIAHYQQVLHAKPGDARVLDNLGLALAQLNRLAEALEQFRHAVRSDPGLADAQYNLGAALVYTGHPDEAVEAYRQALRIQPDSAAAWHNLGLALESLNRHAEALEAFRKAVGLKPDFAEFQFRLGLALAHSRRMDEAREHFQKALQIRPDFPEARAALQSLPGK